MYYPVMNVTQCEGQLSTYHLNGGSMTTPQSEEKKKKKKKKKKIWCNIKSLLLKSTKVTSV